MAATAYALKHTRVYKYDNEKDRHEAILQAKRNYYKRNAEFYKLSSNRKYYVKLLKSDDLTKEKREQYETKLKDIESKLTNLKSSE